MHAPPKRVVLKWKPYPGVFSFDFGEGESAGFNHHTHVYIESICLDMISQEEFKCE